MTSTVTSNTYAPWEAGNRSVATIIVATDGLEQSDGAVRIALARAAEMGANTEVLAVSTPEPIAAPDAPASLWNEANLLRRSALRESVEAQLVRVTGRERTHPVILLEGHPAYTIARVAIERRAALVIVGLGRHRVVDRLFSDETALQLARISRVPVLAVPARATAAPHHVAVAVDFSDLTLRTAQAAVEALGDTGRVDLVHVMPYIAPDAFSVDARDPYEGWALEQLELLERELAVPPGITVSRVAVRGRPAPELIAYAERSGADLIAAGSHGRGFVARALLGSVTSQLIRASTVGVLTIPRDPLPSVAPLHQPPDANREAMLHREWNEQLAGFTARNVGRRTILEVDDLEIGAQAQEYNYPLISLMYDAHDRRVQISLGDRTATGRHLSRSIGGVNAVTVLTDGRGNDVALRIGHGASQTLLTFAP